MENDIHNVQLIVQTERNENDSHTFGKLMLHVDKQIFGNPDAWSVAGLLVGSISDMISRLESQSSLRTESLTCLMNKGTEDLFHAFYEWQWGSGDFPYQQECEFLTAEAKDFFALPIGTEVFDGEYLYVIHVPDDLARFVWQDFDTKRILETCIDFKIYLEQWRMAQKKLEAAMVTQA